jgi:hypothetical protein
MGGAPVKRERPHSVQIDSSRQCKPTENAFVERFNGTFCDACLDILCLVKTPYAIGDVRWMRDPSGFWAKFGQLPSRSPLDEDPRFRSEGHLDECLALKATVEKKLHDCPDRRQRFSFALRRSFLNKCADKIGHDQPTAAIQMDPVCMEEPAVHSGDFIRALPEHQRAECIAIEGEKAEFRKSASL